MNRRALTKCYRIYGEQCGESGPVPPPEVLPWADILGCCVQYRLQGLGQAADRLVCYREEALVNYLPPLAWTRWAILTKSHVDCESSLLNLVLKCAGR